MGNWEGWGIVHVHVGFGPRYGFCCGHRKVIRDRFASHTSNSAESTACFLTTTVCHPYCCRLIISTSQHASERQQPRRLIASALDSLLHLVEQCRHASPQRPFAVVAYDVVVWRILDGFLRHLSAPVVLPSVTDLLLIFGVMAAALVNPHGNCAHCALMVILTCFDQLL